MSDDRKDLPTPGAPNFNERVRETLSTYLGKRGDPLDRGVTLRDLSDAGIVSLTPGYLARPGSYRPVAGAGSAVGTGTGTGTGTYEPDLTPPPTPTGFTVTPTFNNLIIEHDNPVYTQGHGHARTRVYGKTYSTGALPTFADAVLITEFTGTVFAHPTTLGTEWHLWIKWVSEDDVESTTPAGGTNGFTATTGKVGNTDLGPLIVTADKLAGNIDAAKFAAGIEPVTIVTSGTLPTVKSTTFIYWTDLKLYRWNGTAYVKSVDGADIVANSIVAGQIGVGGLVAGAIAVGSAAIANGAIRNALIENLAVDDAKIADLSVAKLTAGNLQVGSYLRSTSYNPGVSGWAINADGTAELGAAYIRGQLTASQINANGLIIRDGSGNPILGAGNALPLGYAAAGTINSAIGLTFNADGSVSASGGPSVGGTGVTASGIGAVKTDASNAPSSLLNTSISLTFNANGTVSATGGPSIAGTGTTAAGLGAVKTDLTNAPAGILNSNITLTGLGAGAIASINQITSANVSTYVASAAINLANINVASIGTLAALSSYLGTVEIAEGGYLRSGQTAWSTGNGFWLGWIGSGPGEPGFSIGDSGSYLRYRPSTGLEIRLNTITASISGGNISHTTASTGYFNIGSRTVSASGGTGTYTYAWTLLAVGGSVGTITFLSSSNPSNATVGFTSYLPSNGSDAVAFARCVVTDGNGRTAAVQITVASTNTS